MQRSLLAHGACFVFGSVMTVALVAGAKGALQDALAEEGVGADAPSGNGDVNGDGTIDISDGIYILSWLFAGGEAPVPMESAPPETSDLPATGQATCYDATGAEIACGSATCPGQDGLYSAGCPTQDRFVDNGDGTVTDICTGLMWQKATGNNGNPLNWCNALAYCENLRLAGYDDWRLPNVRELQSIVDYGRFGPAIDPSFGALSAYYWSSTSVAVKHANAWLVDFGGGSVAGGGGIAGAGKDNVISVRAVRSAP